VFRGRFENTHYASFREKKIAQKGLKGGGRKKRLGIGKKRGPARKVNWEKRKKGGKSGGADAAEKNGTAGQRRTKAIP